MSVEHIAFTKDQLVIVQDLVSKERQRLVNELNITHNNPKFGIIYYNELRKECDILTQLNEEMKTKMNRL